MEDELELYQNAAEEQMENSVTHLDDVLQHIRAGKANPRILDPIKIDYYGNSSMRSSALLLTPTSDSRLLIMARPFV